MSRQSGTTAVPEQAKAVFELLGGSTDPDGSDATRRKLNGKCDPVKPAADPGNDWRIDIAQYRAIAARRGSFHEKLSSGILQRFRSSQAGILGRTIK